MKKPLIFMFLVVSAQAVAAPLSSYRAKLTSAAGVQALQKSSQARVDALRAALGTQGIDRSSLTAATSPFMKLGASTPNKGSKKTASGILKHLLGKTVEELRQKEEEGAPPPFDPSKFDSEIDAERATRRLQFCEKSLSKDYSMIVQELAYEILRKSTPAGTAVPTSVAALELDLIKAVSNLVPTEIRSKLGGVSRVDFVDGRVIKIFFTNAQGQVTPISFSTLATIRSLRDKYFLIVLECVREHVQLRATEEKPKDEAYQSLAKALLPGLNARLKEAVEISRRMDSLTRGELGILIDLMVSLAGTDVPSEEEMIIPDEPKTWKPGMQPPSFPAYIYQLTQPKIEARDKALNERQAARAARDTKAADAAALRAEQAIAPVATELADYQYYHLMDEQISQLSDWLLEEKSRERQEQKRIDDMSEGK